MNPTFLEIWAYDGWATRKHARNYYKFRSVCRMAFWIPTTYLTLCMALSLAGGR
jgi:hypothetical protein